MKLLAPLLLITLMACSSREEAFSAPPEVGTVNWQTDHDKAFALSEKSGKPVFLLFQEVPG